MAYGSKGRRPFEYASKAAHGHVINDPLVREFLKNCDLPKQAEEVALSDHELVPYEPVLNNPIRQVKSAVNASRDTGQRFETECGSQLFRAIVHT